MSDRSHQVTVHGWAGLPPEMLKIADKAGMNLEATFRFQTYERFPAEASPWSAYCRMVASTVEDMVRLPHADLWFWPTFSPCQFAAAVISRSTVPQIGGMWWLPRFPHPVGARMWANAARGAAGAAAPVVVGAYDERLAALCRTFSPRLPIQTMPCPHDGAPLSERPMQLKRIGFLGHQRPTRGIDLMPKLIAATLDRGYDVLVHDSSATIRQQQPHPRLEVLHYVEDFASVIERCDLVVWPSRHEAYHHQYSGIVSESIASGIPVVAPAGCLPAEVLVRYGCGSFFHETSLDAVISAIDDAADDFPALAQRARAAAQAWHAGQGSGRLAEWLEMKGEGRR